MSGAAGTTVAYEVWRTHLRGAPDVCIGQDMSEGRARALLAQCAADKAERYPAARLDFILVRATTGRQVLATTALSQPTDGEASA